MARRAAVLAALLLLSSCSTAPAQSPNLPAAADGEPAGSPGTALTACELVTPPDIDAALDLDSGTATAGQPGDVTGDDPAADQCSYLAQAWGGLVVIVSPSLGAATFESTGASAGDRAEVLEIGDGALWLSDIERGYFLKGSVLVIVQITSLADDVPLREPTIKLGEAAVGRL